MRFARSLDQLMASASSIILRGFTPRIPLAITDIQAAKHLVESPLHSNFLTRVSTFLSTTTIPIARSKPYPTTSFKHTIYHPLTLLWNCKFLSNSIRMYTTASFVQASVGSNRPQFIAQAAVIPHPSKRMKGGEDAYFVSSCGGAIGVADGVGGWSSQGIDPSDYSRGLMRYAAEAYEESVKSGRPIRNPLQLLQIAFDKCKGIPGSSTACVGLIQESDDAHGDQQPILQINTANVGDSGFMIISPTYDIIHRSKEQQHRFNCPYQLGNDRHSDKPNCAQVSVFDVEEGDMIVMGTDGLFDNLYNTEIVNTIEKALAAEKLQIAKKSTPSSATAPKKTKLDEIVEVMKRINVAQVIAEVAYEKAQKSDVATPFATNASNAGMYYSGGKMDDITVVFAVASRVGSKEASIPKAKL